MAIGMMAKNFSHAGALMGQSLLAQSRRAPDVLPDIANRQTSDRLLHRKWNQLDAYRAAKLCHLSPGDVPGLTRKIFALTGQIKAGESDQN
jgi:hypothetical protein